MKEQNISYLYKTHLGFVKHVQLRLLFAMVDQILDLCQDTGEKIIKLPFSLNALMKQLVLEFHLPLIILKVIVLTITKECYVEIVKAGTQETQIISAANAQIQQKILLDYVLS